MPESYEAGYQRLEAEFRDAVLALQAEHGVREMVHQLAIVPQPVVDALRTGGLRAGGSCYALVEVVLPLEAAEAACRAMGGALAAVDDDQTLRAICMQQLRGDAYSSAWFRSVRGSEPVSVSGTEAIDHTDPVEARWFVCEWPAGEG